MTVLSSRQTSEGAIKETLCEMIHTLIAEKVISESHYRGVTEQLPLQEIVDYLNSAHLDLRVSFMELMDDVSNLATVQSFLKLEIVALNDLLALSSAALDELLQPPPYDLALDLATNCFVDNLLNLGPVKMDFNDKLIVEDSAEFTTDDIKSMLRAAIATWLEEKQNTTITT